MKRSSLVVILLSSLVLAGFAATFWNQEHVDFDGMQASIPEAPIMIKLAPGSSYEEDWARVDSLDRKRLPETALKLVDQIYEKAKSEDNAPQVIKTLIFKMKYAQWKDENALQKSIEMLKAEAKMAKSPMRPVIHSVIAQLYWSYYSRNQYQLTQRTETVGIDEADIRSWDRRKLLNAMDFHYRASLEEAGKLRRIEIGYWKDILVKREGSETYRPSLYDLLAHRAFSFYQNDQVDIDKPTYEFVMDGTAAFGSDREFLAKKYSSPDTASSKLHALQLLQEMTRQHMADDDPGALVFVTLDRLKFAKSNSVLPDKQKMYIQALEKLELAHRDHEVSTYVSHAIAMIYAIKGNQYTENPSPENKAANAKAVTILSNAIKRFPESNGAKVCRAQWGRMLHKTMTVQTEQTQPSEEDFRVLLTYKNLEKVYVRVHRLSAAFEKETLGQNTFQMLSEIKKEELMSSRTINMPGEKDYNQHRIELPMEGLALGKYALLMSPDGKFRDGDSSAVSVTFFTVSNLAYMMRTSPKQTHIYFVTDRRNGQPLEGAKIKAYERDYNAPDERGRARGTYTTDKNGRVEIAAPSNGGVRYGFDLEYGEDRLEGPSYNYQSSYHKPEERRQKRTSLFLDRAIYRPGQTIFFKGIAMETFREKTEILKNHKTTVTFYDANRQKISELPVTTNEFGSFSGTFTAPQGGLNGQMQIQEAYGSVYFRVEDYKRPKFEVKFEPVKGSFRLGEKVKVAGKATAYAGSNIDGAEVTYRVVRTASFPWWGYWGWGRIMPTSPQREITSGTATTDVQGNFSIEFEAVPDQSLSAKLKPQFNFQVTADVTDITGETHSANQNVSVGHLALDIDVNLPDELSKTTRKPQKDGFPIRSRNLNGEYEASKGKITISRLKDPGIVFRDRLWEQPDQYLISASDYRRRFPHDIYKDENDYRNWPNAEQVLNTNFDTEKSDTLRLMQRKNWKQGRYVLELTTKDKFGSEVKKKKYFTLYGETETKVPVSQAWWRTDQGMQKEPGETVELNFGTAADDVWVYYEVEHQNKNIEAKWVQLKDRRENFKIEIKEEHRGNLSVHFTSVFQGRFHQERHSIIVPWTNKKLELEYSTFRDKLQPGAKEEWTVRVKGPDGEAVAAEMLAGMYDASLDAFSRNSWNLAVNPTYYSRWYWNNSECFGITNGQLIQSHWNRNYPGYYQEFDQINWFKFRTMVPGNNRYRFSVGTADMTAGAVAMDMPKAASRNTAGEPETEEVVAKTEAGNISLSTTGVPASYGDVSGGIVEGLEGKDKGEEQQKLGDVQVRENLNETAFFFPELRTNEKGEILLKFTMPEALTRWRFMTLGHTQELKIGYKEAELVTQKELMVMPNPPRFFRENDRIRFTAKVSNLSDKNQSGQATLELFDALTMQPVDAKLGNGTPLQSFSVKKGQSTLLAWELSVPEGVQAVLHRVKAVAGTFSDGEESALPVLSNRMLVTEAMPMPLRPQQTREFEFTRLLTNSSSTLKHHRLTLEFTANPAWYAVQALPYLMEYPYECVEQTFSRYYANSIASHIANAHPRIKLIFDQWKKNDKQALLSNLEKNQELKYLLLEETPWVLQAQNESERKRRVGLLFDLNKMADEMERAKRKVLQAQTGSGGFTWFPGMRESRYMTQHIVAGMGHLDRLGIENVRKDGQVWKMIQKAIGYLDKELQEDYDDLIKYKADLKENHLNQNRIHLLYARSYFQDIPVPSRYKKANSYFREQAQKHWNTKSPYMQGMIALLSHRAKETGTPQDIVKSLRETSIQDDEMGMYWKGHYNGYNWYQAPIETQALLIEVFGEVGKDAKSVEEMKLWLLKQKQTTDWKTTKATAEACYALLLEGTDYLVESRLPTITVGSQKIDPLTDPEVKAEAGTGYFKKSWSGGDVRQEMAKVKVQSHNKVASWGAMYWQYFEQMDKITFAENKLKLEKQLFLQENSPTGPKIKPIAEGQALKPGDLVKVRIVLETDRNLEYVHMKDMRASGFEPINVLSSYKYQDGLGYYESTRDAATNFFMDYLPKGKYVFEYPLRVVHAGDFSNGITTIQCMYAPEFTAHSDGVRVKVAAK